MRKMTAIIHYEYKMQCKRPATWGVFLAVTVFALLDNYPSAGNLARLEFLREPAYFVYRTMGLNGFVLMFGLMFLLADRFPLDDRTGMKLLLMSHALQKWQYILGKLLGGFLYAFSMLCIFLCLNTAVNAAYVGSAEAAPFYMITSGDLIRLIWENPKWSFQDTGSILANGAFLVGSGLVFGSSLFLKRRFWRSE